MTKGSSQEECEDIIDAFNTVYKGKPWFIKAFLDRDDHGLCVGVKVVKDHPEREQLERQIESVKIVTYLVGR